jgi:hypothetical protein
MHQLMSKVGLTEFVGKLDVMGKSVTVSFNDGSERSYEGHTEPTTLIIHGLTLDEAFNLLDLGRAEAKPVGVPAHHESRAADEKARAAAALAKARGEAPAVVAPVVSKPVAPPPPVELEPEDDQDDDLGGEVDDGGSPVLDIAAMDAMDKLRPVIEYMVSVGFTTPEQIVAAAIPIKGQVKALKILDEKGQFDKRMERAALTVLASADN